MRASLPRPTSNSSKRWLARQFRDPYVQQRVAHPAHFRSRSAFKLLELDARFRFILPRSARRAAPQQQQQQHQQHKQHKQQPPERPRVIVDLGAAPGGWSQVVAHKYGFVSRAARGGADGEPEGMQFYGLSQDAKLARQGAWSDRVVARTHADTWLDAARLPADARPDAAAPPPPPAIIALDVQRIAPIPGVHTLQADFLAPATTAVIRALLPRAAAAASGATDVDVDAESAVVPVDLLLSDMAANATGHAVADAEHSLRLCDAVARFAEVHLAMGGVLVLKYFTHPSTDYFRRTVLAPAFRRVHIAKPSASRAESAEGYWVCVGYRGGLGMGGRERGCGYEQERGWEARGEGERERGGAGSRGGVEDEDEDGRGEEERRVPPEIPREPFQLSLAEMRRGRMRREEGASSGAKSGVD